MLEKNPILFLFREIRWWEGERSENDNARPLWINLGMRGAGQARELASVSRALLIIINGASEYIYSVLFFFFFFCFSGRSKGVSSGDGRNRELKIHKWNIYFGVRTTTRTIENCSEKNLTNLLWNQFLCFIIITRCIARYIVAWDWLKNK